MMQMFIEGTSFDAANSMGFTYVIDHIVVNGSGSKTYSTSGFNLGVTAMNNTLANNEKSNTITASVSGNTLSWNTTVPLRLMVTATAKTGADTDYAGFALYEYPSGVRTVKLAPDFTPFVLTNVINIEAGARTVDTGVPVGAGIMVFMRNRNNQGGNMSRSFFNQIESGGTYRMQFSSAGQNQYPTRAYIFSKVLPSSPAEGFYIYRDGAMVWHNNCLPLDAKFITQSYMESDRPLAVTTGITGFMYIPQDPAFPTYGFHNFLCSGAGIATNGKWRTNSTEVYQSTLGTASLTLTPWVVGTRVMYIDCDPYDTYYKQSLKK
ncbi:hypothetical protein RKT74_13235 [Leclercia pneumoniae]|uniref:hypothetical protein n=1 Tax=Leclercia pneumoniae TaxID=2815358 RepID=UPI0021E5962A|nr:hypothetical protein [Leclercia pneumoniae]MCV2510138.1 hypothetical protein [Leclercia pneumoniae]WNN79694.1 hypothetical protein RKT74_13235 [Leclercia pneumoniae]